MYKIKKVRQSQQKYAATGGRHLAAPMHALVHTENASRNVAFRLFKLALV